MSRLWPSSIVGRTVVVLLLGLIVSNLAGFAFYWTERSRTLATSRATQVAERIGYLVKVIDETPQDMRHTFSRDIAAAGVRMIWTRYALLPDDGGRDLAWASSRNWARGPGSGSASVCARPRNCRRRTPCAGP